MSESKSEETFDKDEYNRAVASARLLDVAVTASSFKLEREFFSESDKKRKLSSDYHLIDCEFNEEFLILLVRFEVEAKEGNRKLLKCRCDYNVVYSFSAPNVSREAAVSFGRHIAQFTAYPYFRQHFAQRSWESGADLPVLPILKKMPMKRKVDN